MGVSIQHLMEGKPTQSSWDVMRISLFQKNKGKISSSLQLGISVDITQSYERQWQFDVLGTLGYDSVEFK